jgi:hypothetical protein
MDEGRRCCAVGSGERGDRVQAVVLAYQTGLFEAGADARPA